MVQIKKVKQKTVVEQVMDQIKNLIASGQLKPHDRIPTETELAQMFGVGRSTVRQGHQNLPAPRYPGGVLATHRNDRQRLHQRLHGSSSPGRSSCAKTTSTSWSTLREVIKTAARWEQGDRASTPPLPGRAKRSPGVWSGKSAG